jgi:hypothetical protein
MMQLYDGPWPLTITPDKLRDLIEMARSQDMALPEQIHDLNDDEQIDLVALCWLGRGDSDFSSWREMRAEAKRDHNQDTARYLLGEPMLAGFLSEAMAQFGEEPDA